MGRGKALSELEKGKIVAFFDQQLGMREISRKLGRSLCVVQNFLKDRENYGTKKSSGRPKVLSVRETRQVGRLASNSVRSANMIKKELRLSASKSTILRAIKEQPHIIRAKLKKAPLLNANHKVKRLEFAKKHMSTNWHQVKIAQICN